jgi:hypothetical protein
MYKIMVFDESTHNLTDAMIARNVHKGVEVHNDKGEVVGGIYFHGDDTASMLKTSRIPDKYIQRLCREAVRMATSR